MALLENKGFGGEQRNPLLAENEKLALEDLCRSRTTKDYSVVDIKQHQTYPPETPEPFPSNLPSSERPPKSRRT